MAAPVESTQKKAETVVVTKGPPGLVKGYLEDFLDADIIVNSAPINMKLNMAGRVSKAILKTAGPEIQVECDQNFPNGIKLGEVAITSGYRLPYSLVFHCTVQPMTHENSFTEMAQLIKNCLMEADGRMITTTNGIDREAESIAFPLLGTGPKNFDPKICHVFYRTILSFLLGPTKSLNKAFIIVKPEDNRLIKVIKGLEPFKEFSMITHEMIYPHMWETTENNLDIINCTNENREYIQIKEEFYRSPPPNARISSIEQVQNKKLFKDYLQRRCQHKLLSKSSERQLWFITNDTNSTTALYTNGLNANHMTASRYGNGYYFYKEPQLADDRRENRNQPLKIFYCSVIVGEKLLAGRENYSKDYLPANCYSAVDNIQEPDTYIIFDEQLFYPRYLLTYTTT